MSAATFPHQISLVHELKYLEPEIPYVFSASFIISENKCFAAAGIS